jgi:Zn-dependent protease
MWLFSGSVPLFTAFGIRVRMHVSLLMLIVFGLFFAVLPRGMGLTNAVTLYGVLFAIILLHEFGHCFAARWMGGDADEILMWPLGGLAMTGAPMRPWPQLVTTVGGPLVNLIICAVTAIVATAISWGKFHFPLNPFVTKFDVPASITEAYLWYTFAVSWGLFLFNLLPVFPMDGGRMLQELLWFKIGYYRATLIACVVGMVGAVIMAFWGLMHGASWYGLMLVILGVSCFLYCYQTRSMMKAEGPWAFEEENNDYAAAMWKPDEVDDAPVVKKKGKRLSRRAVKKLRKQAQAEEAEQARLDAILAKVSAHGMQSLTWAERRALHKATQRQREVEVTRDLE